MVANEPATRNKAFSCKGKAAYFAASWLRHGRPTWPWVLATNCRQAPPGRRCFFLACIFFTCLLAESNRAPFDLAEAEQELVGGFHTEYSSMKWAMFFLGEYMHMITGCAFFTVLFLGGWYVPGIDPNDNMMNVLGPLVMVGNVVVLTFLVFWFRFTFPRFREDQLQRLAWKFLIPIALANIVVTGVLKVVF